MNRKTRVLAVASPGSSMALIDGSVVNGVLSAGQAGLRQRARNAPPREYGLSPEPDPWAPCHRLRLAITRRKVAEMIVSSGPPVF